MLHFQQPVSCANPSDISVQLACPPLREAGDEHVPEDSQDTAPLRASPWNRQSSMEGHYWYLGDDAGEILPLGRIRKVSVSRTSPIYLKRDKNHRPCSAFGQV